MRTFDDVGTTTRYLCVEHQRLNRLLLEARHRIDAWRAAGGPHMPADVRAALDNIQAEVQRHFAQEDQEGCLEEAACQRPDLGPERSRLLHEHGRLLDEIHCLCDADCDEGKTFDLAGFVREFEKLYERLQAHEEAESQMMRQAFPATLDIENESAVD